MTKFYLIRHGKKEETSGNPFLKDIGVVQARLTAEFLRDKEIHRIYTSPLNRTIQTAQIIADILNLQIEKDERLVERMNWGDDPTETAKQFMDQWTKTDLDRHYQPPHGFSSHESGKRIESLINNLAAVHQEKNIALITHGGTIVDLLTNVFPPELLPLKQGIYSTVKSIDIFECSITIIEKHNKSFNLIQVGSVDHLYK